MGQNANAATSGNIRYWGRHVVKELARVGTLVSSTWDGISATAQARETELRELAAPHLAVLVHKRCKACGPDGTNPFEDRRWPAELEQHVRRWFPDAQIQERIHVAGCLDRIVAEEQKRVSSQPAAVPMTSRFDTSWAI